MPNLDMDLVDLVPQRNGRTIAYLEGVMLAPDDEANRTRLAASRVREEFKKAVQSLCPTERSFDNREVRELLDHLDVVPSPREVFRERKRGYERGTIAAGILWECLAGHDGVPTVGLTAIKAKISKGLQQRHPRKRGLSESSLETAIWRTYEPVAHYWLAYVLRRAALLPSAQYVGPCGASDLIQFLAISEILRRAAESIRLPQSRHLILSPARTWKVPAHIHLPRPQLPYDARLEQVWFAAWGVPAIAGASGS